MESMKKITEMSFVEFRKLLDILVNEDIFKSRKRLASLLAKGGSRKELDAEFIEFHGDYEDLGFWFDSHRGDSLIRHSQLTAMR